MLPKRSIRSNCFKSIKIQTSTVWSEKNIEQAVSPIFDAVEKQLAAELSQKTLADVIANLHHQCRNA